MKRAASACAIAWAARCNDDSGIAVHSEDGEKRRDAPPLDPFEGASLQQAQPRCLAHKFDRKRKESLLAPHGKLLVFRYSTER